MAGRFVRVVVAATAVVLSLLLLLCVVLADHHGPEASSVTSTVAVSARASSDLASHDHGSSHEDGRSSSGCALADVVAAIGLPGPHGSSSIPMVLAVVLLGLLGTFGGVSQRLVGFGIASPSRSRRSNAPALAALCISLT